MIDKFQVLQCLAYVPIISMQQGLFIPLIIRFRICLQSFSIQLCDNIDANVMSASSPTLLIAPRIFINILQLDIDLSS